MSILCTLKNLNLAYGEKTLFKNAQLTIHKDDRIGLLGLNGIGKSSLFKILTEEVIPDVHHPPFQFDKTKLRQDSREEFSVFRIPQEPPHLKFDPSIKDYFYFFYPHLKEIQENLQKINKELETSSDPRLLEKQKDLLVSFEHLHGWNISQTYESYLKFFKLKDFERRLKSLSGGEQKKVLLSLGFSSNANLILWDEPTNHLDLETIKLFEEELVHNSKAFLLVSHDRYLLSRVTKKMFHLKNNKIHSFKGSYSDYLEYLQEEEISLQKLLEKLKNNLRREKDWMGQGIKARGTRSKKRVENFNLLQQKIQNIAAQAKKELDITLSKSKRKTKKLLEIENLSFGYDDKNLFENLSLIIQKKDKIGLLGPNGCGKSTLMNILTETVIPRMGNIKRADNLKICHFSQKREELDEKATPFELLGDGQDFVHLPSGKSLHVASYFKSFLFSADDLHRPLKTFSGGERNRLQLANNLHQDGDLWIFDEPTNDLDLETIQILEQKLLEFDGSVILISHDRALLGTVTNKIWLLENKTLNVFEGGYGQVESYFEALSLEKLLKEESSPLSSYSPKKNLTSQKLSNKEKRRLLNLNNLISQLEEKLEAVELALNNFDYENLNQGKNLELLKLNKEKEEGEEKLLKYYEELEKLKQRVNSKL